MLALIACNAPQNNKQAPQTTIKNEEAQPLTSATIASNVDSLKTASQNLNNKNIGDTFNIKPNSTAFNITQSTKTSNQSKINIEKRILYPENILSPLFKLLRPATQSFKISGNRDTLIVGKNGTTITILKNTFVNAQGQLAKYVNINLVEVNSMAEIIQANLQTTSGQKILQTDGMFFIDAKESDQSLTILNGKSIYIEVKSNNKEAQMKVFEGKYDEKGKIDWTVAGKIENNLIPLSVDLLDYYGLGWGCMLSDNQVETIKQAKYENTFLATREFEARTNLINLVACKKYNDLSQQLLEIYFSNLDKPLYMADSLAANLIVNNYKSVFDTTKNFDLNTGGIVYLHNSFSQYAKQKLQNIIDFKKLGITSSTTIEELVAKGYTKSDAEKLVANYKQKMAKENQIQTSRLTSYSFSITNLGWVNVDMFMDEKNTAVSNFMVHINSKETLDYISVSMIIPAYKVALFSTHNQNNLYSFTQNEEGYRKLPVGQEAIIIAFSYKNNKPYFAKQKITIPKDGEIDVLLASSSEKVIKEEIIKLAE